MASSETTSMPLLRSAHSARSSKRHRPGILIGVSVLILLGALSPVLYRAMNNAHPAPPPFQTLTITRAPIAAKVNATGALSPLVMVSVGSQVSGRIATLGADFGSHVHAGQVVATIEPSLFAAAVQQARANLAAAQAHIEGAEAQLTNLTLAFQRAQTLADKQMLAQADLDAARASMRTSSADTKVARATEAQTRAALAQAELNLRYTTIISPIDGVVISRNVDVGQTVAATLQAPTLFTIAQDLTRMQVDTNVPEADVGKIRANMPVTFTVDAYPGRAFPGRVRQVRDNALSQQNVVTYDAVIDVDNDEGLLKPGMTASVSFVYAERADAICVPNAALRFHPTADAIPAAQRPLLAAKTDEHVVWVLRDAQPTGVRVGVGVSDGTCSELLSGALAPGDRAIVELLDSAKHGS